MKGLIRKDLYQCMANYKIIFLYFVVFFGVSFFVDNGIFFLVLPCIILGMLPITLFAIDEKEGWCRYSATMPVSRTRYMSAKYLLGLILTGVSAAFCSAFSLLSALIKHTYLTESMISVVIAVAVSLMGTAVAMPFSVRFGANKGRIVLFIAVGCGSACAAFFVDSVWWARVSTLFSPNGWIFALAAVFVGLYALSWYLSVYFYKKRDL